MTIVQSKKTLEKAWRVVLENSQTSSSKVVKDDVQKFADEATKNINSLSARLSKGKFVFPAAKGIPATKKNPDGSKNKKKFRPLVLAPVESRVVQRAILEALCTVANLTPFAENAFSFGGIRKRSDGLAAVPAAVDAVLKAIGNGATHVAFADITAFFTKVPKPVVTQIVANATDDDEFMGLFREAIRTELDNLAELKEKAKAFPTENIGVAQGSSLSPLLGNILLHDFDNQMNDGDCVCIRYVDDFIVLAPSAQAARARMKSAASLLAKFDMSLSAEKSISDPIRIDEKFDFLGIEFNNGFIRPSQKAVAKLEENVRKRFQESVKGMRSTKAGEQIPRKHSLVATLNRVDTIIRGWGKHYRFCNDEKLFARVDVRMQALVRNFLVEYRVIKMSRDPLDAAGLLGIDELRRQPRSALAWPQRADKSRVNALLPNEP